MSVRTIAAITTASAKLFMCLASGARSQTPDRVASSRSDQRLDEAQFGTELLCDGDPEAIFEAVGVERHGLAGLEGDPILPGLVQSLQAKRALILGRQ
jgi:hypothetical protein